MQLSSVSGAELKTDFLQLLVTQLQNQDPIEPIKQENFINQLAQFSVVEGIEKLNVQFDDMLYMQQVLSGFDLAGKQVTFEGPDQQLHSGTVSEVFIDGGAINAIVDNQVVSLRQIVGVVAPPSA